MPEYRLQPVPTAPSGTGSYLVTSVASRNQKLLFIIFSLLFAYGLQSLPLMAFQDRGNYLALASHPDAVFVRYLSDGWLVALTNEPVWLLVNVGLSRLLSPEGVVRTVIFSGAFIFSYVFLRADPRNAAWLIIFLFMPQILKHFVSHLRQGLAMAVFFAGYFAYGRAHRWLLMTLSPFVHASFFLVLPIVAIPALLRQVRMGFDVRIFVLTLFALTTSLTLGIIAQAVGARQGERYEFQMADVSGLGFAFWSGVLSLLFLQGKTFLERHTAAIGIVVFYLISYFFVEVTARVFESGLPLVLLAGLALTGWRRMTFLAAWLSYGALQWMLRLSSPTLF